MKLLYSISLALLLLILSTTSPLAASYYVSTAGVDTNNGTSVSTPFKTFAKAVSVLNAGDILNVLGGTYYEKLLINKSGTASAPIEVKAYQNQVVIIDGQNNKANLVDMTGSYINVSGMEAKNSNGYCVSMTGNNNKVSYMHVHDCEAMGIYTDGKNEIITNNTVHHASTENKNLTMSSGYGSGIKVRIGGENVLIANNTTYNNYGEGVAATRGKNITIRDNIAYDNYVVNIYVDNSIDVVVEGNFSYCHPNNGFLRNGSVAAGFSIGEEFYDGWGAQLSNVTIKNNIVVNCSRGVVFFGNESGSTEVASNIFPSLIANNTFWGITNTAISIASHASGGDAFQKNLLIANNIVQSPVNKLIFLAVPSGITVSNNFWVGSTLPSTEYRGSAYLSGDPKLVGTADYNPANYNIQSSSTAINSGKQITSITNDFLKNTRPIGSGYDIGAYEYGSSTSTTPPSVVLGDIVDTSDVAGDEVNMFDFNALISVFGQTGIDGWIKADIVKNGVVDIFDFNKVVDNFGL